MSVFTPNASHSSFSINRLLLATLMFLASYMITVRVNAQVAPADGVQLHADGAVISGTVKEADENFVIIDSAGKDIKVVLDKVEMQGEADTVFQPGMVVTVDGKMDGDDFGMPIVQAHSISATENTAPVTNAP
jgi:hypothetical protein